MGPTEVLLSVEERPAMIAGATSYGDEPSP